VTRVVLDANVLGSAALAGDLAAPSVRAFDALLDERIDAICCPALFGEVAAVLARTLAADPSPPYPAVCRDPGDDDLVALARVAVVEALVTGDRDLLEVDDMGVAVITPRGLVERLADAP
jgi:predicted nucleic acid-binding protein